MSGLSRLRGSEGYGACDDDMPVGTPVKAHVSGSGNVDQSAADPFRSAFSKPQSGKREGAFFFEIVPEAPWGVQNIMTKLARRIGRAEEWNIDRFGGKELQLC